MRERLGRTARAAVIGGQRLAADAGDESVEAQHLLLALTVAAGARTSAALAALDVTERGVREALERELVGALAAVGVTMPAHRRAVPREGGRSPRLGQSAKLALERTRVVAAERGARTIEDHHLLIAITRAQAGVLPRLLAQLDRSPAQIEAALGRH